MAIIPLHPQPNDNSSFEEFMNSLPDVDDLDAEGLRALREQIEAAIADLDEAEPRNMNSEAYDLWAEKHEDLEDVLDDILDRLEEID